MMKTIQVIIVLFINVLTYKEVYAKQKTLNKLHQWKNYLKPKKILQEKIQQPKIECLEWDKKCDFYFISMRNSKLTTSLSSSLGIYLICIHVHSFQNYQALKYQARVDH